MGGGNGGLCFGTRGGEKKLELRLRRNNYREVGVIIVSRTAGLDLREHPREKSLTKMQKKEIKNKIASRTATKKEYKKFESDKRFGERRKEGVNQFWKQERRRLLSGLTPTREWSDEQKKDILGKKRPSYNGKTVQGHHTYSASKFPHLANRGEIIFPVTFEEHLHGWHGGNFKNSLPGAPIKYSQKFNFGRIV